MRCSRAHLPTLARTAEIDPRWAATLCALLAACSQGSTPAAPAPTAVEPRSAYTAADVPVTIHGAHFDPVALENVGHGGGVQVDATFRAFLGNVELLGVQWQAPDRLTAIVPRGLDGGPYDLRVVGPTGEGTLPSAFAGATVRPASLQVLVSAPARVELGTQAEVDLFISNGGDVAVSGPTVQLTGSSGVGIVAVPAVPDVAPRAMIHLVALVAGESSGAAQLSLHVAGTDAFQGDDVATDATAQLQIVRPPDLSIVTVPVPDLVSVGQSLDLVATVTNQGDVDALGVAVAPLSVNGVGGAVVDGLPPPQDVPAGGSRTFHVPAHATSPGVVFFTGSLGGYDAMSAAPVTAPASWPLVFVQSAPQLSAQWLTVPSTVTPGQVFIATIGITNSGGALARNVAPLPDPPLATTLSGTGSLSASSSGAAADIPAGSTVVFSWAFTASGTPPASLQLSAGAAGTDANSGAATSAAAVASSPISLVAPSSLSATLSGPSAVLRGDVFGVTLVVTDVGGVGVNALTPSLSASGTGTLQILSGPTPATQDVAAGASVSFSWTCTGTANGAVALSASVSGTDAITPSTTRTAAAGTTVTVSDAVQLASAPLGAATTFAYVFEFNGRVYAGPKSDGTGAVRMLPDGSGPEAVTFTFPPDQINGNANGGSNGPFPSLGYANCAKDTLQCGPDNENGRGVFASGIIGGTPWLIASGARTTDELWHVYLTPDTGTAPVFRYDYVRGALANSAMGTSSIFTFHDRIYIGLPDTDFTRPTYIVLRKTPSSPGLTPVVGTDVVNLRIDQVSGIGSTAVVNRNTAAVQMIDSQAAFNDLLYVANNGGIVHSNGNDPQPALAGALPDWTTSTPSGAGYATKTSLTTKKTHDLEPSDKAFPRMVVLAGKLYAARNTTTGPQLWVCSPGANLACDPGDWQLLAANGVGDTQLSQFDDPQNTRITLLATTSTRLYVGYNNTAGLVLYRSKGSAPATRADFEGAGGCDASMAPSACDGLGGRGLGAGATRIFDGRVLTFSGSDYVYLTAGTGTSGFRVFRLAR